MKVLSFSLDPQMLNKESVVASRNSRYGAALQRLTVIVPSSQKREIQLSPTTTVYGTGGGYKATQLVRLFLKAASCLRRGSYDVISSQDMYFLGLLSVILAKIFRCGLEIQVHGIEKIKTRAFLARHVLRWAGSVRVPTTRLKNYLVDTLKLDGDKVFVIPVYVDVSPFSSVSRSADNDGYFNILSVNRLVPIKNISLQLQAVKELRKVHPRILLHIVGEGPLQSELHSQIQYLEMGDAVMLHGYKTGQDLVDLYSRADCFVLTSDFEGYGMVVVEAAAAGLPIVMTDVGCAGDFIVHEVNGLIVPVGDVRAVVAALERLINDPLMRKRLGEQACHSTHSLLSFEATFDKYVRSWQHTFHNK